MPSTLPRYRPHHGKVHGKGIIDQAWSFYESTKRIKKEVLASQHRTGTMKNIRDGSEVGVIRPLFLINGDTAFLPIEGCRICVSKN